MKASASLKALRALLTLSVGVALFLVSAASAASATLTITTPTNGATIVGSSLDYQAVVSGGAARYAVVSVDGRAVAGVVGQQISGRVSGLSLGSHVLTIKAVTASRQTLSDSRQFTLVASTPAPAPAPAPTPTPTPTPTTTTSSTPTTTSTQTTTSTPTPTPTPASNGTFYVSPAGSDSAPGTIDRPWRTIQKALSTLGPGQKALVRAGTYVEWLYASRSGTASAPISLEAYPGERPVVAGRIKLSGQYIRVSGLVFDRSTQYGQDVLVYVAGGDSIEISGNEIRNSSMSAIYVGEGANSVRIVGNYIHDNGTHWNLDHGIYWAGPGAGGVIENNRIERSYAFGIHLYPDADGVTVRGNMVSGSGRAGLIIDTVSGRSSDNNVISGNTIVNNRENGIRTGSSLPPGTGNTVTGNTLYGNPQGNIWDPFKALRIF